MRAHEQIQKHHALRTMQAHVQPASGSTYHASCMMHPVAREAGTWNDEFSMRAIR